MIGYLGTADYDPKKDFVLGKCLEPSRSGKDDVRCLIPIWGCRGDIRDLINHSCTGFTITEFGSISANDNVAVDGT